MSYILEALKKLEQKREREGLPSLFALQEDSPERHTRRPIWPYIILAALLLNAGILFWWIAPWRTEEKISTVRPSLPAETTSQSVAGKPAPDEKTATEQTKATPTAAERKERAPLPAPTPQPSGMDRKVADVITPKPVPTSVTPTQSTDPKSQTNKTAAPSGKVVGLQELPAGVKSSLPELKISMHYYSDEPRSRLVRINDTTLREGDVLTPPGMKVEEITPTHILFGYQGHRFTVSMDGR